MAAPNASWLLPYICCREDGSEPIMDNVSGEEPCLGGGERIKTLQVISGVFFRHRSASGDHHPESSTKSTRGGYFPYMCCHDGDDIVVSEDVNAGDRSPDLFVDPRKLLLAHLATDKINHGPESDKDANEDAHGFYANRLASMSSQGICDLVQEAPISVKQDASFIFAAVDREPLALQFADDAVRSDKDVVLAAVRRRGDAFFFASDDLKQDRDFVLRVVGTKSDALKYASDELQADPQIQEEAEKTSYTERVLNADDSAVVSTLVHDAPERWKADLRFVLLAVKKCGLALQHVTESLRGDKEVVFGAVRQDGNALAFASEELRADKVIVLAAVRTSPAAIKFAKDPLHQDHDCLKAAGLWQEYSKESRKYQAILSFKYSPDNKSTQYIVQYHQAFKNDPILGRFKTTFSLAWYPFQFLRVPDFTMFAESCKGIRTVRSDQPKCVEQDRAKSEALVGIFVQAQEASGLSNEQSLEAEFATKASLKIFRTCTNLEDFYQAGFERLGHSVNKWVKSGCSNMDLETIFIGSDAWWAPPCDGLGSCSNSSSSSTSKLAW